MSLVDNAFFVCIERVLLVAELLKVCIFVAISLMIRFYGRITFNLTLLNPGSANNLLGGLQPSQHYRLIEYLSGHLKKLVLS
jgi:hypothetical protein